MNKEEFTNQNEVRWCPGCGDYAILSALQKTLPQLGLPPEKHVFVSGIGCSGRLPYYMNTYGYHTIHGRGTAVATGLKLTRPDLSVWLITGDGDGLSIGAGHLIHLLRRNININILLFNNQVYGLTKGQYSPTSIPGQVTTTSPEGLHQNPINPLQFALGAGATFVARALDKDTSHLGDVLQMAYNHPGTSFVEIYQDCHVFNSGAFDAFSAKKERDNNTIKLEHNQKMRYAGGDLGLQKTAKGFEKSNSLDANIHQSNDFMQAIALTRLQYPDFPVPIGVFYQEIKSMMELEGKSSFQLEALNELYRKGATWTR
jgi:2-oxoglutarate ferredoxin oxidoreductase subunit beta